jgi:hypothetical protein
LVKVREAYEKGLLPSDVFETIKERFELVTSGIQRIEKASGTPYPISYVEPSAILTSSDNVSFQYGILFARTLPVFFEEKFQVVIQISAPLVAFGLKGTIHAILAHEFLHYLELVRKISKMEMISDTLLTHITKKFPTGFKDDKLEDKTEKLWIAKNLPVTRLTLDENTVKISAESLAKINLDPVILSKIKEYEERESKLRKKKLY